VKLIFIYNADSGLLPLLRDFTHKIISPKTYPCSLCALTYDTFSESKAWKSFRQKTNTEMVFLHKDEFEAVYVSVYKYPCILRETPNGINEVIPKQTLDELSNVEELIQLIKAEINN
jgi:hypothetical protein